MKISKKSWHYKIRRFGSLLPIYNDYDESLCRYSWAVGFKIILFLFCVVFFTTLTFAVIYSYFTSPFWISTTIMLLFILSSIVLPFLAIYHVRKRFGHPPELPKENLIIEYLKSKKRKVCPLIEFID